MKDLFGLRPTNAAVLVTLALLVSFSCSVLVHGQETTSGRTITPSQNVNATATPDRIRISAPNAAVQLRLEVYDELGRKLFDTEQRGGSVLDWYLKSGDGEAVSEGSYICVVTVKNLSGRMTQRLGKLAISAGQTSLQAVVATELTAAQSQSIGPIEGNASLVILSGDEMRATVIAHDGNDGQITRTRGALSFRFGDFFSGADVEQMRLTEEGNLGIGTSKPKTRLDVAGTIRARGGLVFDDGSTLNVKEKGGLVLTSADGRPIPNAAGTGTQNRVAKWTETGGSGTLGDSLISESNGSMVVGNAGQTGNIQIFGTATQDVFAGMGADINVGPAFNYGYAGGSFGRSAGFFNVRPDSSAAPPNPSLRFMTANVERMIVTNTGVVGIGRTDPSYKLDVLGDINTSTFYRINGNRVLNSGNAGSFSAGPTGDISTGSVNTFFGFFAGGANGISTANTFVGAEAGYSNQTGSNNSFLGYSAGILSTGNRNIFIGSEAGKNNISGNSNVFVGTLAGATNGAGSFNTILGTDANVSTGILDHATAIGAGAVVSTSNTMVLGRGDGSDTVKIPGALNVTGSLGIGTAAPVNILHLNGNQSNFALTFTNQANTAGKRGYRIAFDNDRFTFQSADDSGNFAANHMAIDPATGNVGIGTVIPHAKLQVAGGNIYVTGGNGVIVSSPNTNCWQIGVNNGGAVTATAVLCP